jgi:hypothetical protein
MRNSPLSPLTARQAFVLACIRDFTFACGVPPTLREIGEQIGISTPTGVMCHINALIAKGHVRAVYRHRSERRPLYLPVAFARVRENGRGGVLLGSAGGPVSFTRGEWVAWLQTQLADALGAE